MRRDEGVVLSSGGKEVVTIMKIGSITGSYSESIGGPSFGPENASYAETVVKETLDQMNGQGSSNGYAITDKQSFGAAVISKSLDYMNGGGSLASEMEQSYNFGKDVLSGYTVDKGQLADYDA